MSTAEVRRRYQRDLLDSVADGAQARRPNGKKAREARRHLRELAAAQGKLDEPVLPPALDDQRCDRCGIGTGHVWKQDDGTRYRRCRKCEEKAT